MSAFSTFNTMKTLFAYLKSFIQAAFIFFIISLAVDWWRTPNQPINSSALLVDTAQQTHSLADLSHNQVAVVYFWGSWCSICRITSPFVEKLHKDNIPVLGIALQSGSDTDIQSYMKQHELNFPTINDFNGSIADSWNIHATPTIILIKNGKMIHHTTGISSYWGLRSRIILTNLLY